MNDKPSREAVAGKLEPLARLALWLQKNAPAAWATIDPDAPVVRALPTLRTMSGIAVDAVDAIAPSSEAILRRLMAHHAAMMRMESPADRTAYAMMIGPAAVALWADTIAAPRPA